MRLIKKMLKQKAVYWAPKGPGGTGRQLFEDPVVIKCRWQDSLKRALEEVEDEEGSLSKVFCDRDVIPLGVLWLSTAPRGSSDGAVLGALTSETDPFGNPLAFVIRKFNKIPDMKARQFVRVAYL